MDLLGRVLKTIISRNKVLKQGVQDAIIMETWPLAVGPQLAKHTRAFQVKGRTLMIEVDHPIWKQELHANKLLALKKLNEKLTEQFGAGTTEAWVDDLFLVNANSSWAANKSPTKANKESE